MITPAKKALDIRVTPPLVPARARATILVSVLLPEPLAAWGALKFRVKGGRNNKNDWDPLQVEDPAAPGYVELTSPSLNQNPFFPIPASPWEFAFRTETAVPAGTPLVFWMRDTRVQSCADPAKPLELFWARDGTATEEPLGTARLAVTPRAWDHVRVIVPSTAWAGTPDTGRAWLEDRFDNPTTADDPVQVTLAWHEARAGKRVPVDEGQKTPETPMETLFLRGPVTDLRVPAFGRAGGPYWLRAQTSTGTSWSNPLVVLDVAETIEMHESAAEPGMTAGSPSPVQAVYWGMIHAHSDRSDGMIPIEDYFPAIRAQLLTFGASSDHDHEKETSDADFDAIRAAVEAHNAPQAGFFTFLGYEWAKWNKRGHGDKCVYFRDDVAAMYRSGDPRYDTAEKLYAALARHGDGALVIPHHTAYAGNPCTFAAWDPVHERLVEIYSVWGCSERAAAAGKPYPVTPLLAGRGENPVDQWEVPAGFVQAALRKGARLGFTAGGDDHIGHPGGHQKLRVDHGGYEAGLVAVLVRGRPTRENIWQALWARRCYGTTGARVRGCYTVDGHDMGAEIALANAPALQDARKVAFRVAGTGPLASVEVVRNGEAWRTWECAPGTVTCQHAVVDRDPFAKVALAPLPDGFTNAPFLYYYLRVTQRDGEMAWFSPVWVVP